MAGGDWSEAILQTGVNDVCPVIAIAAKAVIGVGVITVPQRGAQVLVDAPGQRGVDAVFFRASAVVGNANGRVVRVIVGAVVRNRDSDPSGIQHDSGIQIQRPVIVLRLEHRCGVIGSGVCMSLFT